MVVPALALVASQRYQLSHNLPPNHRGDELAAPAPNALLHDLGDDAGSYRPPALTNGEVQPLVHCYGTDQLHVHHRVVPRHHHLHALFQADLTRNVRRAEVELGTVVTEERRVTSPLLLRQDIHLGLETRVGSDRAGLGQDLSPLYVIALHASEECPYVVAGLCGVHRLVEHLHARHDSLPGRAYADYLYLLVEGDLPRLHPARGNRAPTLYGEHVLHRKQEVPVDVALGLWHVLVHGLHKLQYGLLAVLALVAV